MIKKIFSALCAIVITYIACIVLKFVLCFPPMAALHYSTSFIKFFCINIFGDPLFVGLLQLLGIGVALGLNYMYEQWNLGKLFVLPILIMGYYLVDMLLVLMQGVWFPETAGLPLWSDSVWCTIQKWIITAAYCGAGLCGMVTLLMLVVNVWKEKETLLT